MDARARMRGFQAAARGWLTLAGCSLLLAPAARRGLWLPLHLSMTGAASAAIGGAMPWFVVALTATADEGEAPFLARFLATNLGVAAMAAAVLGGPTWLLPLGGTLFLVGQLALAVLVVRARRRSLHRRHGVPLALYGGAIAAIVVGATLGALLGAGAFTDPEAYLAARRTHLVLNVIGWLSLAIAGSLVTLLPTVLRAKIPPWPARTSATALLVGVAGLASGTATSLAWLAAAGALAVLAGSVGIAVLAARALATARAQRDAPLPLAARHLLAGTAWFAAALVLAIAVVVADGVEGLDAVRDRLLAMLVLGWVVQVLLGAWSYLLPTVRPGHPDVRRRWLAVMEVGGRSEVLVLNLGVALLAIAPAGALVALGWSATLAASAVGLARAWWFAPLATLPIPERAFRAWSSASGGLRR